MRKEKIKLGIRSLIASLYYAANRSLARLNGKTAILAYHRVVTEKELRNEFIQPGMYVRDDIFEMHLLFLKKHFQILSFRELLDLWKENRQETGGRYCVITLDDGWRDNYSYAFPLLRKHQIPATIFLPTALIDSNQRFWPDRLGALLRRSSRTDVPEEKKKALALLWSRYAPARTLQGKNTEAGIDSAIERFKELAEDERNGLIRNMTEILGSEDNTERALLTWDEIREMSRQGISFGSHSRTHKILTQHPLGVVREEIQDSLQCLREQGIHHVPVFCYPNGNYNGEIAAQVRAAGYEAAVSTRFGLEAGPSEDRYGLKRIGIHNDISSSIPLFAYRMLGP